jgi:hypothetical protein
MMMRLTAVVGIVLLASCTAFHAGRGPIRANRVKAVKMGVLANIAAVPIMYSMLSINEYITHRYYQHTDLNKMSLVKKLNLKVKGGGHVEHHAETYDDMSLKTDARWRKSPAAQLLDVDKFRGTAFKWDIIPVMFLQLVVTCIPVMKLTLGFSALRTLAWIVPSLLLHTALWNALHPNMHGLPEVNSLEGPPGGLFSFLRGSKYFNFLYQNHQGHHVVGGQGNYNVCCPGTDHLVGTYIKESIWRSKMKESGVLVQV